MIILGFFLLFGFAFWERFYKFPLLNSSVWSNRNYTLCVLSVLFGYMSFITNQFWISLYMQQVQHLSSLHIAVRMLPQAIAGIIWSFVGQALVHRLSGTMLMGIGALAYLVGAVLQIFVRQHTSYWKLLFPSLLITVLGADFQFIVSNVCIFLSFLHGLIFSLTNLQTKARCISIPSTLFYIPPLQLLISPALRRQTNAQTSLLSSRSPPNRNAPLRISRPLDHRSDIRLLPIPP